MEGPDAHALIAAASISGKLSVRRSPTDQGTQQAQPRAVLRVASRGIARDSDRETASNELEPFLQNLQNDVERLTRVFASLGREANALVRSEAEMRARIETSQTRHNTAPATDRRSIVAEADSETNSDNQRENGERTHLSRSARRRMRQRLRAALNETQIPTERSQVLTHQANIREPATQNSSTPNNQVILMTGLSVTHQNPVSSSIVNQQQVTSGPSNGLPGNGTNVRVRKNRRHRR